MTLGSTRIGPTTEDAVVIDPPTMRLLDWHEARAHALGGRVARDLGDAILLHDPRDRDPFWNRLSGLRLATEGAAFEARMAELFSLFVGLDRRPHIWTSPDHDAPTDLGSRLVGHGFDDLGGGRLMVLALPEMLAGALAGRHDGQQGVTLEEHRRPGADRHRVASEVAALLVAAFRVDPFVRPGLAADIGAALGSPDLTIHLARSADGRVLAVAKRATFEGASYLSSIGTHPAHRGRGLGTMITAAAAKASLDEGSTTTYLRVFPHNGRARRLYERLGFRSAGSPSGDYLLSWP
jgi:ribosomal protein S18 acetylase RimI-like enzyme